MTDEVKPQRVTTRPSPGKPRVRTGSVSKVQYDPQESAKQIAAFLREKGPTICESRPARGAIPERLFEG